MNNDATKQSNSGAMTGIRVLELTRVPPSEFPGMMMSDMGAEVLKIESPESVHARDAAAERAIAHSHTNRNKRSMALDLKSPEGQQILRALAKDADVLIEGFRPGVMERLGADFATLHEINPRLVYCSMSSFGQSGPDRRRPAHDLNFMALSGALDLIGEPDRPPVAPLNLVADLGGASMHAVAGIFAALFARERSGRGQHVDISYLDATIALLGASVSLKHFFNRGVVTQRGQGIAGNTYPYYSIYETRDGRQLTVACSETPLWKNFCRAIGHPDLATLTRKHDIDLRSANEEETAVREAVAKVIRSEDLSHWERVFDGQDVCYGTVKTMNEVVADPQVMHRNMIASVDHPAWGSIGHFGPAIKLSETPPHIKSAAPRPGEHTSDVLAELGYDQKSIQDLLNKGIAISAIQPV